MTKATKSKKESENIDKTAKTSFMLKESLFFKVKYITLVDKYSSQSELVEEALSKFIEDWEKKNGKIPVR